MAKMELIILLLSVPFSMLKLISYMKYNKASIWSNLSMIDKQLNVFD
jgi:hypothetical protein